MQYFDLKENVERSELDIVLIGAFNPPIIVPFWLSNKSLIRESEAKDAKIKIIHPQIVEYTLDWALINITPTRFHIKSTKEPFFEIVRDLVASIFSILKETPISSFGYNYNYVVGLKNETRHYEFGNKLCPLSNWSNLNDPRLNRLEILEAKSNLKEKGSTMTIIYAVKPDDTMYGVGITINDHYDFSLENSALQFNNTFVLEYWNNSQDIANNILKNLSKALEL